MKTLLVAVTPAERHSLPDLLHRHGHDIHSVEDADAACETLLSGDYRLVIVDADRLDAEQFCRRVRHLPSGETAEILAVGSCDRTDHVSALLAAGADDYCCDTPDSQQLELRLAVAVHRAERRGVGSGSEQDTLQQSETKYRTLVEATQEGIGITDCNENLVFVNRALADQLGYAKEELLGMNLAELSDEEAFVRLKEGTKKRQRGESSRYETTLRTKTGQRRWFLLSATPLSDKDGVFSESLGLLTDITGRKMAAEAIREEQQLLRQLLDLHERDRRLIAYEVHDGFAQQLTGAHFQFEAFAQKAGSFPDDTQEMFTVALNMLRQSIDETRRLISGLRPPILDEFGIVAAIEYLTCESQQRTGISVEFVDRVQFDRLAAPLEGAVFRIAQESLTNACRHSQSKKVRVEILQVDGHIRLNVRDWGVGFDCQTVAEHRFGLKGIRERARLLGGRAHIESSPGQGTSVEVELPLIQPAVTDTAP